MESSSSATTAAATDPRQEGQQQAQPQARRREGESCALEAVLRRNDLTVEHFFDSVWQTSCGIFRYDSNNDNPTGASAVSNAAAAPADEDEIGSSTGSSSRDIKSSPHRLLLDRGWEVLVRLFERAREKREREQQRRQQTQQGQQQRQQAEAPPVAFATTNGGGGGGEGHQKDDDDEDDDNDYDEEGSSVTSPLLFKDQCAVPPEIGDALYGSSFFASYLDGCSVVLNHADRLEGTIAALCDDLQKSFPFAYANCYLTPPSQQTVPAHADDRDVLVFQVLGQKRWSVYRNVPVPFPYPPEQVGKGDLAVPDAVTDGPKLIDTVLRSGDVLYMPRGYVHEASACPGSGVSFHVTVALATHDWTLAGLLGTASRQVWQSTLDLRKAVPREFGMMARDFDRGGIISEDQKLALQRQVDDAIDALRAQVNPSSIHEALQTKYRRHRESVSGIRTRRRREDLPGTIADNNNNNNMHDTTTAATAVPAPVVGRQASERVYLQTRIRLATDQEKAIARMSESASTQQQQQQRGLHVGESDYDTIMALLQTFKQNPSLRFPVQDFEQLLLPREEDGDAKMAVAMTLNGNSDPPTSSICNLTLLSFARQCVELGALAIAE